jgi:hypothetical protein
MDAEDELSRLRRELKRAVEFGAKTAMLLDVSQQQLEEERRQAARDRSLLEERIADLLKQLDRM